MAAPPGFQDALNRKYDIQQQEANSRSGLLDAQAAAIPLTTASENALRGAQTYETGQRGNTIQPLADASIRSSTAGLGETQARTGLINTQNAVDALGLMETPETVARFAHQNLVQGGYGSGVGPTLGYGGGAAAGSGSGGFGYSQGRSVTQMGTPGQGSISFASPGDDTQKRVQDAGLAFATGTSKVPGKAPAKGNTDTVPAMLTPGEAVLNVGAAEHMGRDNIHALNQVGLAKMGKAPGKGMAPAKGKKPGFADGTASVGSEDWKRSDRMQTPPSQPTGGNPSSFENAGNAWNNRADLIMKSPVHYSTPAELDANTGKPQRYAKGTSHVQPSAFYTKKGDAPLKPQTLAKGTHAVAPGKSAPTKAPPKGLAQALAAMASMGGGGAPQQAAPMPGGMPTTPGKGLM